MGQQYCIKIEKSAPGVPISLEKHSWVLGQHGAYRNHLSGGTDADYATFQEAFLQCIW